MNTHVHTTASTRTAPTRTARRGASITQLREESFAWFRYARFIGIPREAAILARDEAIDFSRRLGARGFVLPAKLTLGGSAITEGALKQRLKQDGHTEILLRYRSEQDGLDTHEYVSALIDVRPDEAALTLGQLDDEATRWLIPLLRDWKPIRAFVIRRAGTHRVVIADVPAAARDWLDDHDARKAASAERIQDAIQGKVIAPVYIRRHNRDGHTRLVQTNDAEARLQKLYDALEHTRTGSKRAQGLQRSIDALTADILHRQHRALAAQDTELAFLPTVEDWLREETWARDEAGPHRPAYLEELSWRDHRSIAAFC